MASAFSLSKFAEQLRGDARHRRLVETIDRWSQQNSRAADLDHAHDLLAIALSMNGQDRTGPSGENGSQLADVQGALLIKAIILYARATEPGDKGRRYVIDVVKFYDQPDRALHAEIIGLRNSAIAHFDSEQTQDWHRDSVVLVSRDDGNWDYRFSYSRTTYRSYLAAGLSKLIDHALPKIRENLKEANDEVHGAMERSLTAEPGLKDVLRRCVFVPSEFYGSSPELAADDVFLNVGGDFVTNTRTVKPTRG